MRLYSQVKYSIVLLALLALVQPQAGHCLFGLNKKQGSMEYGTPSGFTSGNIQVITASTYYTQNDNTPQRGGLRQTLFGNKNPTHPQQGIVSRFKYWVTH